MRSSALFPCSLLLTLALCVIFGGCAPIDSETAWVDEIAPTNPADDIWTARLGSHVRVIFSDGDRATGYLVAREIDKFTLRGIGWQASRETTYELKDVVEFVVNEPQPDAERFRY